ncbi:MAG: XRE family transcriptional regulator [Bacteriovoracaceae bacterium]|nr:XRE family transcriptional regulator [Bacteriovoracaceae bacterium]
MKKKTYKKISDIAKDLGVSPEVGHVAEVKAKLTREIIKITKKQQLTHQQVADSSGVPRSAITGIINGSLQKVSLDRLVKIICSLGKSVDVKIKDAA